MGLSVALVPVMSPVAAADPCGDSFADKVTCGGAVIPRGAVVITLEAPLKFEKLSQQEHESLKKLYEDTNPLVVQVPEGISTGEGGTALLLMAEGRLVHPDTTIDPLRPEARDELRNAGVCRDDNDLCETVKNKLTGKQFIDKGLAADPATHVFTVEGVTTDPATTSGNPHDKDNKNGRGDDGKGGKGDTAQAGGGGTEPAGDSTSWAALWMGLLLVLLLLAFAVVIRRSRGPVAVGHRTGSGRLAAMPPGGGARRRERGEPRPADGRSPTHGAARGGDGRGGDGRAPVQAAHDGDESTTRLRVAPTARHGRQVSARPAHTRTAVVRTELHPQGYVELDRVLYRAVWAEAGRPPPAPGGPVDVAEAPERDSDVLYAFPPTAARHAKGTPR
ncbi:hypothetical protein [Streptomyces sp. MA5143a]|uniref:hypothetical protein n=1 Tax=Streptomyces sp. MA5143a TaxID=2083010 RepID=UPI002159232A|nr:hypothetical protein [Streptomyces sp. MA5143a]